MPIWTEAQLEQYIEDAKKDIVNQVPCLFHRFYLATTANTAVYNLPSKVKTVRRITWRGSPVENIAWLDMQSLSFNKDGVNEKTSQSVPQYYSTHPNNNKAIYFYPTPNESLLATGGDPYSPTKDEARCTIECWAYPDDAVTELNLPDYVSRRTIKAFALWKAYGKEGKGQSIIASDYYGLKYNFLIDLFKKINEGCFVSKIYRLGDTYNDSNRPAGPVLPANYPRVNYR